MKNLMNSAMLRVTMSAVNPLFSLIQGKTFS